MHFIRQEIPFDDCVLHVMWPSHPCHLNIIYSHDWSIGNVAGQSLMFPCCYGHGVGALAITSCFQVATGKHRTFY